MPIFRSLSIVMAILLNAIAPTLAYAATYLQGAEVNAYMLVQDAYVAVTYYDSNGEQKLAKGWINAVSGTSFTIRIGALLGKKTIAYDKVLSVIMSDESTESAKQMNEVNRFIRNVKAREIERAKKESKAEDHVIQWLDPINTKAPANNGGANTNGNVAYTVIAGVKKYVGKNARQVIVAKGRYVGVTFLGEYGKTETVEGYVRAIDETELTIYQGGLRKGIARESIEVLMVCDHSRQLQVARRILARGEQSPEKNQSVFPSAVIGEVERYVGEGARKVIIAKGRYVYVTYRRDNGNSTIAEGFVHAMDETVLMIYRDGLRKRVLRERIGVLLVCDYPNQLGKEPPGTGTQLLGGLIGSAAGTVASLLVMAPLLPEDYCLISISDEDMKCGDYDNLDILVPLGIIGGYIVGASIGVSAFDPYDQFGHTLIGGLGGFVAGLGITFSAPTELWPAVLIGPIAGAVISSRISRRWPGSHRFSVGVAPNREGNLSAVATLRF